MNTEKTNLENEKPALNKGDVSVRCVVSARFHPHLNKWTGFKVEMGKKGTHDNYHVVYNGDCSHHYYATEDEAKSVASNAH